MDDEKKKPRGTMTRKEIRKLMDDSYRRLSDTQAKEVPLFCVEHPECSNDPYFLSCIKHWGHPLFCVKHWKGRPPCIGFTGYWFGTRPSPESHEGSYESFLKRKREVVALRGDSQPEPKAVKSLSLAKSLPEFRDGKGTTYKDMWAYTEKQAAYYYHKVKKDLADVWHVGDTDIEVGDLRDLFHKTFAKCLHQYDPNKGAAFKTYLSKAFTNSYLDFLNKERGRRNSVLKKFGILTDEEIRSLEDVIQQGRKKFRVTTRKAIRIPIKKRGSRPSLAKADNEGQLRGSALIGFYRFLIEICTAKAQILKKKRLRKEVLSALESGTMTVWDWLCEIPLNRVLKRNKPRQGRRDLDLERNLYKELDEDCGGPEEIMAYEALARELEEQEGGIYDGPPEDLDS